MWQNMCHKKQLNHIRRALHLPIALKLVVKCQLLSFSNALDSEDTDPEFGADDPLFQMTIGVAGVIDEPSKAALLGSVDNFVRLQGHEVKMFHASQRVFSCPLDEA